MQQWSKEGYQKAVEAGERGRINRTKRLKQKYKENPKICPNCGEVIPWKRSYNKFCNQSCSASFNNKRREYKRIKEQRNCKNCNKTISYRKTYCDAACQHEYQAKQRVKQWIEEGKDWSVNTVPNWAKNYLIEIRGYVCEVCGISRWNEKSINLECDHIDGDHRNNCPLNLRLICPNCHSQTETYKAKNKGNGRINRRYMPG